MILGEKGLRFVMLLLTCVDVGQDRVKRRVACEMCVSECVSVCVCEDITYMYIIMYT